MSKHTNCMKAITAPSLPLFLALEDRQIPVICAWLDMRSFGHLDVAVSSICARNLWLIILESITCKAIDEWQHCHSSMMWAILRSIRITHILVSSKHRHRISEHIFEAINILSIWKERRYLESIDLSGCESITDIGVSALGHGCGQLQMINLHGCWGVTDMVFQHWVMVVNSCRRLISVNVGVLQTLVYQHWVMDVVSCVRSISVVVGASQT